MSWLFLANMFPQLCQAGIKGLISKVLQDPSFSFLTFQHSGEECKAIAPTGPTIPNCQSKEVVSNFAFALWLATMEFAGSRVSCILGGSCLQGGSPAPRGPCLHAAVHGPQPWQRHGGGWGTCESCTIHIPFIGTLLNSSFYEEGSIWWYLTRWCNVSEMSGVKASWVPNSCGGSMESLMSTRLNTGYLVSHCYREFNYFKTDISTTLLWRPTLLPQSLDNIPNQGDKQSFKPLFPPHYLPGIPLLHKVGAAANRTNPTSIDCEPNQVIFGPVCISFYTQTTMNEE